MVCNKTFSLSSRLFDNPSKDHRTVSRYPRSACGSSLSPTESTRVRMRAGESAVKAGDCVYPTEKRAPPAPAYCVQCRQMSIG